MIGCVALGLPAYHVIAASSWAPTTCTIGSSSLEETKSRPFNRGVQTQRDRNRNPSTYRVDVGYTYTVIGRTYGGDRYNFSLTSSSGSASKASVVGSLRPGTTVPCFYDPADPSQSVIDRSPFGDMWYGLLALPFFVVGVGGIVITWKDLSTSAKAPQGGGSATTLGAQTTQLSQEQPRLARFVIALFLALICNAIAIGLYLQALDSYRAWGIPITNPAVLVFGAAGLLLALATFKQGLSLRDPQTAILVSSPTVAAGDELAINWNVSGRAESLTKLTIDLEGREEIDYKDGSTTLTKRMVFATIPVTSMARGALSRGGSTKIIIPAGAMTSFDGSFSRVIWTIRVRGAIPRWPDSDDQYPVTITGKSE